MSPESIFTRDGTGHGEAWLPTPAARGPWGDSLHGGAPAALLMHGISLPVTTLAGAAAASRGRKLPHAQALYHHLRAWPAAGIDGSGSGRAWLQMPLDLAPGLPLAPAVHLACLADFANGLAQLRTTAADGSPAGCINADINLHVLRLPDPGPVAMVAQAAAFGRAGQVQADCWDARGLVARISQATLPMPAPG